MQKLTVAEYARLMNVGETTVRRRIKAKKLNTELINGVTHVVLERLPVLSQNDSQLMIAQFQEQIQQQRSEIEFLRKELSKLTEAYTQTQEDAEASKQRSDTIILQLTRQFEEQTNLLEDIRNWSLWRRIRMAFTPQRA